MGYAKFASINPIYSLGTIDLIYDLLDELDGIMDWAADRNGELVVEYDHNRIKEDVIEKALSGTGFQLKSVSNDPNIRVSSRVGI